MRFSVLGFRSDIRIELQALVVILIKKIGLAAQNRDSRTVLNTLFRSKLTHHGYGKVS